MYTVVVIALDVFEMEIKLSSNLSEGNESAAIDFNDFRNWYIGSGIAHILLVLLPVVIIGPTIFSAFILKKLRDPVSIVFMFIIIFCTVSPILHGLLMDISLITCIETFGPCTGQTTAIF